MKKIRELNLPIIWVLGGPGSGKGTQCEMITRKYNFTHLSTGQLLRTEVSAGSERGKSLEAIMELGELVSNDLILQLLKENIIRKADTSTGFLIDGYPREKQQGIDFENEIAPCIMILFFELPSDIMMQRLLKRGQSSGRNDDNEETIRMRLLTFEKNNNAILNEYKNKVIRIDARASPNDIFKIVEKNIDNIMRIREMQLST